MENGTERTMHDLSHLTFQCGKVGRLMGLSAVPVLPGDGFEQDLVGGLRLSPLRRGMAVDSVVDICTFYVPHRHIYGQSWIDFIEQGWDESVNLTTESCGAQAASPACLATGQLEANIVIPSFYPEGYRQIWNNYYRPPTTISQRTDAMASWTEADRDYGFRCANLKTLWTALLANNVTGSDYNVAVNAGNVSLLDIERQRGYLKTEQEREFFDIRYRDIISSLGGSTTIDADNRPEMIMRSTFWASGYDVDGTTEVSLGQFSGRVVQAFRHRVPRYYCREHGMIWTLALLRFPVVSEQEAHFFVNNPNPTYAEIAGDPAIVSTQPPYGLRLSDVFSASSDNTVRGYIPFAQWYRYQPSIVHRRFDLLNGFPFMSDIPSNVTEMVLVDSDDYNDVFQTDQLGHYQVHGRATNTVMRRLPSARDALMTD